MGATPTGFEPAISALTGQYVKPLHHGAASRGEAKRLQQIVVGLPTCGQASPLHRDKRPGVRDPYRFDYGNGVSTRRSGSRAPKYYVFTTSNSVDRIPVILRGRASNPHVKAVGGVTRCVCKNSSDGKIGTIPASFLLSLLGSETPVRTTLAPVTTWGSGASTASRKAAPVAPHVRIASCIRRSRLWMVSASSLQSRAPM